MSDGAVLSLLELLPPDCIRSVLSFLRLHELQSLSWSSALLNQASADATHIYNDGPLLNECQLRSLINKFKRIRVLYLAGLELVGNALFSILSNATVALSTLQEIHLHGYTFAFSRSGPCPAMLHLEQAKHVTLHGKFTVDFGSVLLSSDLETLSIQYCYSIQDEHIDTILGRRLLETLSLAMCSRIFSPKIQSHSLRHLRLMGCFDLRDLPAFHCPQLVSLQLSDCRRLGGESIQNAVQSLNHLALLKISKCPLLMTLDICSSTLASLDVTLSSNLSKLSLDCPSLSHLVTAVCLRLHTVRVASSSIKELNLSMLPLLEVLDLYAPALLQLNVCGCTKLAHATVDAPALHDVDICGTGLLDDLEHWTHISNVRQGVATTLLEST